MPRVYSYILLYDNIVDDERSYVTGVMNGVVQTIGFAICKIYPSLIIKFGIKRIWTIFAVFSAIFIMSETKGKSLNEIPSAFETPKTNNVPRLRNRKTNFVRSGRYIYKHFVFCAY